MEDAAELMGAIRVRDARAFEKLYDAYHRLVYGIAFRVLGETSGAEDVTQSVFLKLWTAPQSFGGGNFPGWIARVARNRALDVLRAKSRSDVSLSVDVPEAEALEDRAFAAIDAQSVRKALAALPAEQREPIELGFFTGATHEEIARRSGVPLGTVKTRIRTGLRRLRSVLYEASIV